MATIVYQPIQVLTQFSTANSPRGGGIDLDLEYTGFFRVGTKSIVINPRMFGNNLILPNGSKYDPYQGFSQPVTPGKVEWNYVIWIRSGANFYIETIEQTIHEWQQLIGERGVLEGKAKPYTSVFSGWTGNFFCTARMESVSAQWSSPKYNENKGTGQKLAVVEGTVVWDQLNHWDQS